MSLTVKAYLERNGQWDAEIRRFQVPADVSSSFEYLHKKVCDIFPALRSGKFSLFWKDSDGDLVSFSTDEELMEALGYVNDSILKIYIKLTGGSGKESEQPLGEEQVHPGVVCDGCEGAIRGPRFKCMVCPDYDLCRSCEGKGIHMEHDMMKMMTPAHFPGFAGFPCFGAGGPQGPHGPQGPFQPPPHFRRWMQKFMKRWHNRHAPGWEAGEKDEKKEDSMEQEGKQGGAPENQEESEEAFLQSVGESVAAMLDPFGIDVDVDVETREKPNQTGGKMRGRGGRGCHGRGRGGGCGKGRGPHGFHGNPWEVWGCGRMGGHPACRQGQCGKRKGQEQKEKGQDPQEPQPTTSAENSMETEVPKTAEQASQSPVMMDGPFDGQSSGPKPGDGDNGWTLLNTVNQPDAPVMEPSAPAQAPAGAPTGAQGTQPTQAPPLYPPANPKVAEALHQMLAMGFNNDGGWLTNLLVAKDGDIVQVLDALKPNPARRGEEGNLA